MDPHQAVMVTPPPLALHEDDDDDDVIDDTTQSAAVVAAQMHRAAGAAGGAARPTTFVCEAVDEAEARARLAALYPYVDQNRTPLPRFWNPIDKFHLLNVSNDNLRVVYRGLGKNHKDAGAVRANRAIPAACGVYYFEVTIVSKGRDGYMGIGLCERNVSLNRLPGWDKNSYGYHGDDGNFFSSSGNGTRYGPTFTTNDVVGCGINLVTRTVFYTKNGINLGPATVNVASIDDLYPTVGLQTPGEIVDTNFGQRPFLYQIEQEIKCVLYCLPVEMDPLLSMNSQEAQLHVHNAILQFDLPQEKVMWMNKLVSSYLVHYGFSATVESFNRATNLPNEEEAASMHNRLTIQKLVLNGRIEEAISMVDRLYPRLLENNKRLLFTLKCRHFIEMLAALAAQDCPASSSTNRTSLSNSSRHSGAGTSNPYKRRTSYGEMRHSPRRSGTSGDTMSNGNSAGHRFHHPGRGGAAHGGDHANPTDEPMDVGTLYTNGAAAAAAAAFAAPPTLDGILSGLAGESNEIDGDIVPTPTSAHENGNATNGNAVMPPLTLNTTVIVAEDDSDTDMDSMEGGLYYRQSSSLSHYEKYGDLLEYGKELNIMSKEMPANAAQLITTMNDAFSMICYEQPRDSSKGFLLDPAQRRPVAAALNSAILESQGQQGRPPLEKLFAHARYLRRRMAETRIGAAAFADAEYLVFQREFPLSH